MTHFWEITIQEQEPLFGHETVYLTGQLLERSGNKYLKKYILHTQINSICKLT